MSGDRTETSQPAADGTLPEPFAGHRRPTTLVTDARAAVDCGDADSVSAYVAEALARRRRDDDLAALLADMVAEHGEPSADDDAWADRALGLA